jgi:hypothetical protein
VFLHPQETERFTEHTLALNGVAGHQKYRGREWLKVRRKLPHVGIYPNEFAWVVLGGFVNFQVKQVDRWIFKVGTRAAMVRLVQIFLGLTIP